MKPSGHCIPEGRPTGQDIAKVNDAARGKFLTVVGMALSDEELRSVQSPTHFKLMDLLKVRQELQRHRQELARLVRTAPLPRLGRESQDRWNFPPSRNVVQDLFNYDFRRTEQCIIPCHAGRLGFPSAPTTRAAWRGYYRRCT
jgi:hypothetical protein